MSVRRRCSLSPDRHEIRQKRKWLVGGGWCQADCISGLKGAPSPSTAEPYSDIAFGGLQSDINVHDQDNLNHLGKKIKTF